MEVVEENEFMVAHIPIFENVMQNISRFSDDSLMIAARVLRMRSTA